MSLHLNLLNFFPGFNFGGTSSSTATTTTASTGTFDEAVCWKELDVSETTSVNHTVVP